MNLRKMRLQLFMKITNRIHKSKDDIKRAMFYSPLLKGDAENYEKTRRNWTYFWFTVPGFLLYAFFLLHQ